MKDVTKDPLHEKDQADFEMMEFKRERRSGLMEEVSTRSVYRCHRCNVKYESDPLKELIPICCGMRVELSPPVACTKDPAWAEHARTFDDDEPCDIQI